LPYHTQDNGVEGVVVTFVDITERRHTADALEAAKRQAEVANLGKSRFLAAASHDLRQPLQTLSLIRGVLAKRITEGKNEEALKLVARLDETAAGMSGLLDALLDINQIEAGTLRAERIDFRIDDLLDRLRDEFTYYAQAQGLALRVVGCGLSVHSDPRLLEQMIRNLLSNALKYTRHGKLLLGCRRRKGLLSIEVWDTGIGIPAEELDAIFEEYHQLDNDARERGRGLGLGLSIVQRLGNLLAHPVHVRSRPGAGSVFAIEVALSASGKPLEVEPHRPSTSDEIAEEVHRTGTILIVEDEPDVRELLELILNEEGYGTAAAADGAGALELVTTGVIRPDLILADYNLPNGLNGLELTARVRERLDRAIPVIILTGDISTGTLRDIASHGCVQVNKPMRATELIQVIRHLLAQPQSARLRAPPLVEAASVPKPPTVFIVDDDRRILEALRSLLEENGRVVEDFQSAEAFLEARRPGSEGCLLIDAYLPGMSGLELLQRLGKESNRLPTIMITGQSDVPMAVQAMKAGAMDFIEKPVSSGELLASIERALEQSRDATKLSAWREEAAKRIAGLTPRQREIMELVLAGHPSKNIAADLGISQRTVENHRAAIMKKTGATSLPGLARFALAGV
jgi:two-component system, chemotaxis family, CheB/CheR fusion protein